MPKGDKTVASSRYRAYAMAEGLKALGWRVHIASPSMLANRTLANRLVRCAQDLGLGVASRPDIVYAQRPDRRREQLWLLKLLRRGGAKVVYDVDDPVGLQVRTTAYLVENADALIVGSAHLEERFKGYGRSVHLIPTSVDLDIYDHVKPPARAVDGTIVHIGWIGTGPACLEGLKRVSLALRALPSEVKEQVQFRCIGTLGDPRLGEMFDEENLGLPVELVDTIDWADEFAIVAAIETFDIGLAPWRGDFGGLSFKTIQYMALGVIVVGEDAGENTRHISHGGNGFLVRTGDVEDMAARITECVALTPKERERISRGARETVERRYALRENAKRLNAILKDLI